ncbi:SDR family NAD(P)-dependent oxidoreductase [Streptomyces sp. SAI-144]|uniref:SDR family NAD(P)-dependent oxidoreductase n=1 Tax=Streptomyces sp. SAI-144 TaxID=2940544 RepID=UPI00247411AA|nr:SDR family NAD(P)-dependent oxidoreductase [Streptomyces sp. SAI-144]
MTPRQGHLHPCTPDPHHRREEPRIGPACRKSRTRDRRQPRHRRGNRPAVRTRRRGALTYAHSPDKARAVAQQIEADGGRALVIRSDHGDPDAPAAAVEETVRTLGGLDILVNNAGIFTGGPIERITVKPTSAVRRAT